MRVAALLSLVAFLLAPAAALADHHDDAPTPHAVQVEAAPREAGNDLLAKAGAVGLVGIASTAVVGASTAVGALSLMMPIVPGLPLLAPLLGTVVAAGVSTFLAIEWVTGDTPAAFLSAPIAVGAALVGGGLGALGGLVVGAQIRTASGDGSTGAILGTLVGWTLGAGVATATVTAGGLLLARGPGDAE